jgi:hypothetical protein
VLGENEEVTRSEDIITGEYGKKRKLVERKGEERRAGEQRNGRRTWPKRRISGLATRPDPNSSTLFTFGTLTAAGHVKGCVCVCVCV